MRRRALVIAVFVIACGAKTDEKEHTKMSGSGVLEPKPGAPPAMPSPGGRLELWLGGIELGQEVRRDDGKQLASEVTIAGKVDTIAVTRATRKAVYTAGTTSKEIDIPPDSLPWGSGHVGLSTLALEWYADAKAKPIKLISPRGTADATVTVTAAGGGHTVVIASKGPPLTITFDASGALTHATTGEEVKPAIEARSTPEGMTDEAVAIERDGIVVRGVLWIPKNAPARIPLLVITAGSGPTDRDNNSNGLLWTDSFRLLAEALAHKQIATLRFDKRFSGQTAPVGRAWNKDDAQNLRVDAYVDDLIAMIRFAKKDSRFGPITVLGHSEGGLISVLAATKLGTAEAPDALIFINSVGRKMSTVVREQLAVQVQGPMLKEVDDMLEQLRTNKPVTIPVWLVPSGLVTPDTVEFVRSEMELDAGALLGKLEIPTTVLQGETDVQTSIDDANALASKRPDIKVTRLPRTNHMLKEEAERRRDAPSLKDPRLPLAPGVVDAIAAGVKR